MSNTQYPTYFRSAGQVNSWYAWGAIHEPTDNNPSGEFYDSRTTPIIYNHIQDIHDAGFNVLVIDHTNNVDNGWIGDGVDAIVGQIENWNDNLGAGEHKMYYCIAVGAWRYFSDDPEFFEYEAGVVWDDWTSASDCYYEIDSSPVLLNFAQYPADISKWEDYAGDKSGTNHFTVRWLFNMPDLSTSAYENSYGWAFYQEDGNPTGTEVMGVMPGWDNHANTSVTRNVGEYYRGQWYRVLDYGPNSVVVNSFNDFWERTATEAAYSATTEKWVDYNNNRDDDFYWVMTEEYNQLYMNNVIYIGSYIQENGSDNYYVITTTSFTLAGTMTASPPSYAPVLLVGSNFRSTFDGTRDNK